MPHCELCNRDFKDDQALQQHRFSSNRHVPCRPCQREFSSIAACEQHYIHSSLHCYCKKCKILLDKEPGGLSGHFVSTPGHFYCRVCDTDCADMAELTLHRAEAHPYCFSCNMAINSLADLMRHQGTTHDFYKTCQTLDAAALKKHYATQYSKRYCGECELLFSSPEDLQDHCASSPRHQHQCKACRTVFPNDGSLRDHQSQKHRSLYCQKCKLLFDTPEALEKHYIKTYIINHYYCEECRICHRNKDLLVEHYLRSLKHHYCEDCDYLFDTAAELASHYDLTKSHHYCSKCEVARTLLLAPSIPRLTTSDQMFDDELDLYSHNSEHHWYCDECKRIFISEANLQAHLDSSIHNTRHHTCPAPFCSKAFLNEGDLIAHWETGTCPTGIDHQSVNNAFVLADSDCSFLDAGLLVEVADGSCIAPQLRHEQASQNALVAGGTWKCPRCYQKFPNRTALQAHLDSPTHEPEIYACAEMYDGCEEVFSTLSAFVRHVASERCDFHKKYLGYTL